MLKRLIDWHLLKWEDSANRRALLIRGARQVGKTHSVRTLAKTFDHFLESKQWGSSPEGLRQLWILDSWKSCYQYPRLKSSAICFQSNVPKQRNGL